jgi:hypothetical protein
MSALEEAFYIMEVSICLREMSWSQEQRNGSVTNGRRCSCFETQTKTALFHFCHIAYSLLSLYSSQWSEKREQILNFVDANEEWLSSSIAPYICEIRVGLTVLYFN